MNVQEILFEYVLSHLRGLGFTDDEVEAVTDHIDVKTNGLQKVLPESFRAARVGDAAQVDQYHEQMNAKYGDGYLDGFDHLVYVTKARPWTVLIVGWHRHL